LPKIQDDFHTPGGGGLSTPLAQFINNEFGLGEFLSKKGGFNNKPFCNAFLY
jgi:hypothetical protein